MAEAPRAVLITGCSSGIGRATALRLARRGFRVYAGARRAETIDDLRAAGCVPLALDVTHEDSTAAAVAAVEEREGAVGALVNNAGYSQSGAIESVPLDLVRRQFETNVFGVVRLCRLVLPGMRRRGAGRIVNVSSMGGRLTLPGGGYYHATKHALEAISDALRFELAGFGVQIVVVEPGIVRTRFGETAAGSIDEAAGDPAEAYAEFNAAVARVTAESYHSGPIARLGRDPDAVARAVERALTAKRPRTRYRVTPAAPLFIAARRALPDRAWDAVMGAFYPRPG